MANQHLVERNTNIVSYPEWHELPPATMREWAIFFGQNISASEMVVPPMSITGEFPEHVPDGIPASFQAEGRVCPDIGNRQRCREIGASVSTPISLIFLGFHLIHLVGTSLGVIVPGLTVRMCTGTPLLRPFIPRSSNTPTNALGSSYITSRQRKDSRLSRVNKDPTCYLDP